MDEWWAHVPLSMVLRAMQTTQNTSATGMDVFMPVEGFQLHGMLNARLASFTSGLDDVTMPVIDSAVAFSRQWNRIYRSKVYVGGRPVPVILFARPDTAR